MTLVLFQCVIASFLPSSILSLSCCGTRRSQLSFTALFVTCIQSSLTLPPCSHTGITVISVLAWHPGQEINTLQTYIADLACITLPTNKIYNGDYHSTLNRWDMQLPCHNNKHWQLYIQTALTISSAVHSSQRTSYNGNRPALSLCFML